MFASLPYLTLLLPVHGRPTEDGGSQRCNYNPRNRLTGANGHMLHGVHFCIKCDLPQLAPRFPALDDNSPNVACNT